MELAAQQFLRALRGKRSQQAFARRLGYRGNPMTDWEHGRRFPTEQEALRAAALVNIDVRAAFARFAPAVPLAIEDGQYALGEWLRQISGRTSILRLSAGSGLSRFAISRWLSGKRHPRLPDWFRLVDAATGRLPELVAELVPIAMVPALAQRHAVALAAKRVAFDEPWSEAVLRVLETEHHARSPRHDTDALATRLGIPAERVQAILGALEAAHIIRWRGDHYGDIRPFTVDTRGGRHALYAIKQHWAAVAAERAIDPRTGDLFAYNVLSVSARDLERIRELLHATYREVRAIVAASEPVQRVALLNLHLVGWNGDDTVQARQ